jgi:hypothetical protein
VIGPHGKSVERRGVGSRDQVGRPGEQVAESGPEPAEDCCRGWKSQGYRATQYWGHRKDSHESSPSTSHSSFCVSRGRLKEFFYKVGREICSQRRGKQFFKGRQPETMLTNILSRSMGDGRKSFGLDIAFIYYSYTQLVSTNNYNSFTELRTPNITGPMAHITSCFHSLTSGWLFSSQPPIQNWLGRPSCLPYNSSARPSRTTSFILLC